MKSFAVAVLLFASTLSFAKDEKKGTERNPSSTAIVSVKADSMGQALKQIAKSPKFKAMAAGQRAAVKDCGGALGRMNEKDAIMTYTGKGSASQRYLRYLVPLWGGCSGTGMIEYVALFAQIDVFIDMGEDQNDTYQFVGFRQTKLVTGSSAEETSAFGD